MRRTGFLSVIACGLVVLPARTVGQVWSLAGDERIGSAPALEAPDGYRAELRRTPWALERVSKRITIIWIRTAESGCNRFHHVNVREVEGGLRVVAFDVDYIPVSKKYGCRAYLSRDRHRVELPRPLGSDSILGECVPSDPRGTCALLHELPPALPITSLLLSSDREGLRGRPGSAVRNLRARRPQFKSGGPDWNKGGSAVAAVLRLCKDGPGRPPQRERPGPSRLSPGMPA
jgi:hypothetical protein